MTHYIYTIYDSKSETYTSPVIHQSPATALRALQSILLKADSLVAQFPADYTLFEIGEFDHTTGQIKLYTAMRNLGTALQNWPKGDN